MVAGEEELLGRQAPHSLEAEQSVLGAMLIDSRCVADVIGLLKPEDFYLQQNREIYETIYAMFNFSQVIDPVTVLDKMQERGVWQDRSIEYIKQLMEITPTSANAVRYASIVRDKALLRSLATAASEISETVYEGVGTPAEILESAEKKIYALRKGERGESLEPISLVLHKVFDRLTELAQSDSDIPGLSTGLIDLDRKINGLNRSDLLLIAARPAMGKTSFALNIALNVAKKYGQTVAFFSLEMSREQLAMRLLAGESFVDSQKMATGKLSGGVDQAGSGFRRPQPDGYPGGRQPLHHRGGDERQVPPPGQPGTGAGGLPSAHDWLRLWQGRGEPGHGRFGDFPGSENHGQGAERTGDLSEPALPRQREPPGQAPHPLRPSGVRRH